MEYSCSESTCIMPLFQNSITSVHGRRHQTTHCFFVGDPTWQPVSGGNCPEHYPAGANPHHQTAGRVLRDSTIRSQRQWHVLDRVRRGLETACADTRSGS